MIFRIIYISLIVLLNPIFSSRAEEQAAVKGIGPNFSYTEIYNYLGGWNFFDIHIPFDESCKKGARKFTTVYASGKVLKSNEVKVEEALDMEEEVMEDAKGLPYKKKTPHKYCRVEFQTPIEVMSYPVVVIIGDVDVSKAVPVVWKKIDVKNFDTSLLLDKKNINPPVRGFCTHNWSKEGEEIVRKNVPYTSSLNFLLSKQCKVSGYMDINSVCCSHDSEYGSCAHFVYQGKVEVSCSDNPEDKRQKGTDDTFWGSIYINEVKLNLFSASFLPNSRVYFTRADNPVWVGEPLRVQGYYYPIALYKLRDYFEKLNPQGK